MALSLVCDANIPFAKECLGSLGRVTSLPGRELTRADLRHADALVVRSVTKVNAALLEGTPVRFVGTATIGTDHLDIEWLEGRGIAWASAAGCNARSVVEYVLATILAWVEERGWPLSRPVLGIIGHGNIGSRLAPAARSLGMEVLVCDPPKAREGLLPGALSMEEVLRRADIVSLHVPLTREGPDATWHFVGRRELALMRSGTLFINAARGPVVENAAALAAAREGRVTVALDVFEGEPAPDRDLVRACWLATPHIAGYSLEGKVNGTMMMGAALAGHFDLPAPPPITLPPPPNALIDLSELGGMAALRRAVSASYDPWEDHRNLLEGVDLPGGQWGGHFDALRRAYRQRREFANFTVVGCSDPALPLLGFAVGNGAEFGASGDRP